MGACAPTPGYGEGTRFGVQLNLRFLSAKTTFKLSSGAHCHTLVTTDPRMRAAAALLGLTLADPSLVTRHSSLKMLYVKDRQSAGLRFPLRSRTQFKIKHPEGVLHRPPVFRQVKQSFRLHRVLHAKPGVDAVASTPGYDESTHFGVQLNLRSPLAVKEPRSSSEKMVASCASPAVSKGLRFRGIKKRDVDMIKRITGGAC